ncbi:Ribulose-5-phosphate 4-epimerase/Fuculose-1-phosphate aldolase [Rhizobium sp. RU35A]|uniref:3-oxo-tetronate 4-phosphate decarboxylase n=1 Tax=Rhizobium sp. RU35A TaxID=1907414 RepID=UPI000956DB4A|nr:3-oxo-tetronate 4-phosphate decarboxylase [Rhizobium sp. RU35A]SIQ31524.1 Ribulose-5-phosphate 4-epimerase/Fuculose-1-phosphate aldolase [Rhizobium sp. RU35A]
MSETALRDQIASYAKSLFDRGLTAGSTGNISVRVDDGWLMTPTGSSMGMIDPARISRLDAEGRHVSGDPPTKEAFLHRVMYRNRPKAKAVVHLHSTHCVAVSCLCDLNENDVLPPLTAYYVMRVGRLPLVPYFPPGDEALAEAVAERTKTSHAVLLANHGPVVAGVDLPDAVYATEELEETAKLFLMLRGERTRPLTCDETTELNRRFPSKV